MAAAVTHKVRIIHDLSFDEQRRRKQGGLNGDIDPDSVPQCLCAHALPRFLDELVSLKKKLPVERILMSKADVAEAFRNVRFEPDQAHNSCFSRRFGRDRLLINLRVVGIAGRLERHVCRGRTRALQHHSVFDSAIRGRKINDGSR